MDQDLLFSRFVLLSEFDYVSVLVLSEFNHVLVLSEHINIGDKVGRKNYGSISREGASAQKKLISLEIDC